MEKSYDVVVVGGGPSGMMAAGKAAERGANKTIPLRFAGVYEIYS